MKAAPCAAAASRQLARDGGRGGGVVDEDGALLQALEGAAGGGGDAAQVVVVADAGEDDLGALGRRGRGGRGGVAVRRDPGLGAARRAVVDGDRVALGGEMAGHGIAHDAQPDECDARHGSSPLAPVNPCCVVSPLVACYPGGVKAKAKGSGSHGDSVPLADARRPRA